MERYYTLGIAIMMVVVGHFMGATYNPLGRFNISYIGVDVFLFFSGLGLSYSYKSNSLIDFYKRRIKRIYPLYFIVSVVIICMSIVPHRALSFDSFLVNSILQLTTLSYYIDVDNSIDWYLNSLFIFYLLFPLLYHFSKKYGFKFYIFIAIVCVVLEVLMFKLMGHGFHWKHDCFIGRIPIFCLGIIYATSEFNKKAIWLFSLFSLLLAFPLFHLSQFLSVNFMAPFLILLCNALSVRFRSITLEYIGKHSLEIYCANLLVGYWNIYCANIFLRYLNLEFISNSIWLRGVMYIVLQIALSILLIFINKSITNLMYNRKLKA